MVDLMVSEQQPDTAEKGVFAGFKLTEVGVIPEDWECVPLMSVGETFIGLTYSPNDVKDFGTLVLRSSNIQDGQLAFEDNVYVQMQLPNRVITKSGDILICVRNGSRQLIGKCALIDARTAGSAFGAFMSLYRSPLAPYVFYQLQSNLVQRQIAETLGATINQITNKDLSNFKIAVPRNKDEYIEISDKLASIDGLIIDLKKIVNKKQAIKTATMQQLLTGKTRLPQFALRKDGTVKGYRRSEFGDIPEDWETSTLDNFISKLDAGVSVNSVNEKDIFSHGKNILKTSCVSNGYFYGHEAKSIVPDDINRAKTTPKKGCIIISRMNTPNLVGELGYVERDEPNLYLPDRLWQMNVCQEQIIDNRWLAYILSFPLISNKLKETATGTSNSMKNISKDSLYSLSFPRPSKDEQIAIATILSDMDKEIQTLHQRLDKTRQLKQGMMQELLTGKTRLI
ncbi:restriction endonuclease subunit S [Edwardsiella ictaluri]